MEKVTYMGKKKEKKKDKEKNKKLEKDIHKGKAEHRKEILLVECDDESVHNQQERSTDEVDIEQRRTTRLGAIIAIVAIIGTICAFLFRLTINTLNVWSEQGVIYWYLKVFFLSALSIALIICIDMVIYVMSDLQRHDILNQDYKQYDHISDEKYKCLLADFKIYTMMFLALCSLSILLSAFYADKNQRWIDMLIFVLILIVGILIMIISTKDKSKQDIKKTLMNFINKFGKMLIMGCLCFIVGFVFVINAKTTINVNFSSDGMVEICNTSAENYSGLDIMIYNMADEIIYEKSVEEEEVLIATEEKYVNGEVDGKKVDEGILLNSELLHWKYKFDLREMLDETGRYYISVIAYQEGKRVALRNSFLVNEKEYVFAQDTMEKKY